MFYTVSLDFTKFILLSDVILFTLFFFLLTFLSAGMTFKDTTDFSLNNSFYVIGSIMLLLVLCTNLNMYGLPTFISDNTLFFNFFAKTQWGNIFAYLLMLFAIIICFILVLYSNQSYKRTGVDFFLILFFLVYAAYCQTHAQEILLIYLFIEAQSFCLYGLASKRTGPDIIQTEAGLKYFIFGSIGSSLFLYAISVQYLLVGSLNLSFLSSLYIQPYLIPDLQILNLSFIAIFIALAIKLGVAPFHSWLPEVYTHSENIVMLTFLLLPKIPLLYIFFQFVSIITSSIIAYLTVFTLFVGSFFALFTNLFKNFLAYSTIANNALFLLPLFSKTTPSISAMIFFLPVYNVLMLILLLPIVFLTRFDYTPIWTNLREFSSFRKNNGAISWVLLTAIFSLIGIPPFIGFFGKFFILLTAFSSSLYLLPSITLIVSVFAAYYYSRQAKIIFFPSSSKYGSVTSLTSGSSLLFSVLFFINTLLPLLFLGL
jgi:NADH-quinone oxidoreductase subunit N